MKALSRVAPPVVLFALLLALWQLAVTRSNVPANILPGPILTWTRLLDLLAGPLWGPLGITLYEALGGCVLGIAVAVPLAVVLFHVKVLAAAVNPFLGATQAIPAVALAPLLMLAVGYGTTPIILLCALMVFFPILVSTVLGLRHVDAEVKEAARLDGAGVWGMLTQIELPLSLPAILSGVRNGFTLSVTGAVVGEMMIGGTGEGLCSMLMAKLGFDTAGMFAIIFVLCVVAASIYSLVRWLEHSYSKTLG
ncbi:MAG: ABC transporter permease [Propionibacteriaceae bacterium]|jgi:NitT/TauT family transport system permease protein|nr:ABC transporter permease [Propionibacteriaceae bacterium]